LAGKRHSLGKQKRLESPWLLLNILKGLGAPLTSRSISKGSTPCKWAEYRSCRESNKLSDSDPTKIEFFTMGSRVPFANTIKSHADISGKLYFWIDENIVTNTIGEL
jgi:hypothetical protein